MPVGVYADSGFIFMTFASDSPLVTGASNDFTQYFNGLITLEGGSSASYEMALFDVSYTGTGSRLYVYCDLTDLSIVGNKKVRLLKALPATDNNVSVTYSAGSPLMWHRTTMNEFNTIELQLSSNTGLAPNQTVVQYTLVFRRVA